MTVRTGVSLLLVLAACGTAPTAPAATSVVTPTAPAEIDLPPSTAAVTGLAVGARHTCALHADGTLSCWGANAGRQLGMPGDDRAQPVRVPDITDAVEVSADGDLTCVRRRDQRVTCWGELAGNKFTQEPQTIKFAPAVQLSGRCVRTQAGSIQCLDRDGTIEMKSTVDDDVTDVSAHGDSGCGLLAGGKVMCFRNAARYLVPGLARAVQVAVGNAFACARMHSGAVRCWELAYSAEEITTTATSIKDARSIVASDYEVCAIRRSGALRCEAQGGGSVQLARPAISGVTLVAIGLHACAIARGGLVCWGQDTNGQLGNGWARGHALPVRLPGVTDAVALAANALANEQRTCIVHRTGDVSCFGNSERSSYSATPRKLGVSNATALTATAFIGVVDRDGVVWNPYLRDKPERMEQLPPVTAISGECAITAAHELYCFGAMHPTVAEGQTTGPVPGAIDVVALASASDAYACYVRTSGAALCYQPPDKITPLDIADAHDIAMGIAQEDQRYGVCVIRGADRTVACTQDADGMFTFAHVHEIPALRDVRGIAVGGGFACALRADTTVACWGDNRSGQLGDGTSTARERPVSVVGVRDATAIVAGAGHACALLRDGGVTCWGEALVGQIGTYATTSIDEPQHVTAFGTL
jgi:alpha-tubulin suppressor-like RCC1 family protein